MQVPVENRGGSAGELLSDDEKLDGLIVHRLFLKPEAWTHRRVESVEILDGETIHRRVTLDLTIDPQLPGIAGLPFTPLTFLRKEVLHNFDLRDQDGRPVPILTKRENGRIAGNALVALAETILADPVPRDIDRKLRFVAIEEPRHARAELESWFAAGARPGAPDPSWSTLLAQDSFVDFANSLVDSFTLLAATAPEPGTRKLVKLSYEERFDNEADGADWRRHLVRFRWTRCSVEIDVPAVSFSESYHLEVEAPADLEIDAAQIRFRGSSPTAGRAPQGPTAEGGVRRVHLYASGVASEFQGQALVFLRRRRDAFLWSAFLTALLVSLLLLGGRFRLDYLLGEENSDQSQTAAALLLITPTLLAAYIARSGEHLLASKVLLGVRALVIGAGFCAVAAVCVLTAGLSLGTSELIWTVDLGASLAITLCLLLSLLLPRPTRE